MKKLFMFFIFTYSFCIQTDPLLVGVLMVKNEEPVMELTLQPLIDAGIKDFLIYDTGSTDNTIQVTHDLFEKNNISNYVMEQGEFIDFAVSRNQAIELTEKHFPNAVFMLMLDAEWILHNGEGLLKFCEMYRNDSNDIYVIQLKSINVEFGHARLIRMHKNVHFLGKIHEYIPIWLKGKIPNEIYCELSPTHYGNEKTKARWNRDLEILLAEHVDNPENERTVYFIAQTYECLNDLDNAILWYYKRAMMPGWDEETFFAMYTLGRLYGVQKDYESMIYWYLKSFNVRPSRAEPLVRLADYYFTKESYELSYVFVRYACTIPFPVYDSGFVEYLLYDFIRYDILSAVAYYVGDFVLGKQATFKALQVHPELEYLHNNLAEYERILL